MGAENIASVAQQGVFGGFLAAVRAKARENVAFVFEKASQSIKLGAKC